MKRILTVTTHYMMFAIAYTAFLIIAWETGAVRPMYNVVSGLF